MTMIDDRPADIAATMVPPLRDRGPMSAWRLAARLARRESRRRPGRTLLAALLIALPVVAMTIGSVLVRTENGSSGWAAGWDRRYPGADIAVDGLATEPDDATPVESLPAGTRSIDLFTLYTETAAADARRTWTMWTDAPVDDPMLAGSIELLDGRWPHDGELLLAPTVSRSFGVDAGDELTLARPSGTWMVAGVGRARDSYSTPLVLAPGFDRDRIAPDSSYLTSLHDLPDGTTAAEVAALAAGLGGTSRFVNPWSDDDATATLAWGWVGGVLALVAVGIIVAAAFATSARRQLVAVGQLASNGATPQLVRRTLVLQGTFTAAVGALFGVVVALVSLPFLRGPIEELVLDRDLGLLQISPFDMVAIVATALIAGTIAAAVPARSLSKVPVMAALAGRRPAGRPPKWLVPTGVALNLGGLALLAVAGVGARNASSSSGLDLFALVVILGGVAVVFGMICATPLVIDRAGHLADRLSLAPRLALRSMARARTRSAAVVAAIAVAVAASVTAGMIADAAIVANFDRSTDMMPGDAAVVWRFDDWYGYDADTVEVDPPLPVDVELTDAQRAAVDEAIPGASIAPLTYAVFDPPAYRTDVDSEAWASGEGPYVATPELLDLIGLDARDRDTLAEQGRIVVRYPNTELDDDRFVAAPFPIDGIDVRIDGEYSNGTPGYTFGYDNLIVTEEYARSVGFGVATRGFIIRAGADLDRDQMRALDELFGSSGSDGFVEPGDPPLETQRAEYWNVSYDGQYGYAERDLWLARAIIVAAALLVCLLVVAIGLSLAAAEGRDERDTLVVVGATPATMRRQTATRATTMALTGIALGVPTGFLPTWVVWRTTGDSGPSFPWVVAGLLLVAVPLVVAAAAWLASAIAQHLRPVTISPRD